MDVLGEEHICGDDLLPAALIEDGATKRRIYLPFGFAGFE
jgi:alpha-glucosidase (family GH31 glycosyl hydrolase)